jgi:hypothetical protein
MFCQELLQNPTFQTVSALFENAAVSEFLATQPHETKAREFVYQKVLAHREFIASLANYIEAMREATAPDQSELSQDDQTVLNIYREND